MVTANTLWTINENLIVFFIGLLLICYFSKVFEIKLRNATFIYVWHTIFCFIYYYLSINYSYDTSMYYSKSLTYSIFRMRPGTNFVITFTSLLSNYLKLSYLAIFLVFNIIGTVGLLAFYGSLKTAVRDKSVLVQRLAFAVVLLPSVSFWSSAIGKDSISFLAVGFALWASIELHRRINYMILSIVIMLMVRPHIASVLLVAYLIAILFENRINLKSKIVLLALALVAAYTLLPFAISYSGMYELEQVFEYIEKRQSYNQGGGSSFDLSSMSFPMQLFSFAFRPLPYEAHNFTALASSIDNLYLLFTFLLASYSVFIKKFKTSTNASLIFIITYLCTTWIILAITLPNYGIAVRQKWMFFPFLIYLCFLYIGKQKAPGYKLIVSRKNSCKL